MKQAESSYPGSQLLLRAILSFCIVTFMVSAVLLLTQTQCSAQLDLGPDSNAPGDAPSWTRLSASYQVDSSSPPVVKEDTRTSALITIEHISFVGPNKEEVAGGFMRPKADGVFPVILLLHGLSSEKDVMLKTYGLSLVEHGFAVLALDAPFHGERKNPEMSQTDTDILGQTIHEGCREYRRAIDWLVTRKDIDPKRIGLLGYNLGSIMGAILAAVDTRIQDVVLCAGGDPIVSFAPNIPEGRRSKMYSISPSLFIAHVAPRRILMLNGKQDQVMLEPAAQRLFEAAKLPKTIEWYNTGHILPSAHINRSINWLIEQLHPAPKPA